MASSTKKNASNTLINTKINAETNTHAEKAKVIKKPAKPALEQVVAEAPAIVKPATKIVKKAVATPLVNSPEVLKPVATVDTEKTKVIKKTIPSKKVAEDLVTVKSIPKTVKKTVAIPTVTLPEVSKSVNMPIVTETAVIASPAVLEPVAVNPVISATKATLNTVHTWPFPLGSRP